MTDAVTSANSQSFSYDNLQRLSNASGGYGGFGFTYDGDGNQLSQTHGSTTTNYGYGKSGSDLLATMQRGRRADASYRLHSRRQDRQSESGHSGTRSKKARTITSLSYSQDARLSGVNAGGGALASYPYRFGQRLIKTVSGSYGEIYQYGQDGTLLEETNATGVAQADYVYLNGRPVAVLNGSRSITCTMIRWELRSRRLTATRTLHGRRATTVRDELRSAGRSRKICACRTITSCGERLESQRIPRLLASFRTVCRARSAGQSGQREHSLRVCLR